MSQKTRTGFLVTFFGRNHFVTKTKKSEFCDIVCLFRFGVVLALTGSWRSLFSWVLRRLALSENCSKLEVPAGLSDAGGRAGIIVMDSGCAESERG